jgi:hypothetical protein
MMCSNLVVLKLRVLSQVSNIFVYWTYQVLWDCSRNLMLVHSTSGIILVGYILDLFYFLIRLWIVDLLMLVFLHICAAIGAIFSATDSVCTLQVSCRPICRLYLIK